MNAPEPLLQNQDKDKDNTYTQLALWVKLGMLNFMARQLKPEQAQKSEVMSLLHQELSHESDFKQGIPNWPEYRSYINERRAKLPPSAALKRLAQALQLSEADLFLLALVGECENSHSLLLSIAELQAPDLEPRLSLHLAQRLLCVLFPEITPKQRLLEWPQHALMRAQLLQIEGYQPLPLRRLSMHAELWALLSGSQRPWPSSYFLDPKKQDYLTEQDRQELAQISGLFLTVNTLRGKQHSASPAPEVLALRGRPGSGRKAMAAALAQTLGLKAILIELSLWQALPHFAQWCQLIGWLPVIEPSLAPGAVFQPYPRSQEYMRSPLVVLLGNEGSVETTKLVELSTSLPHQTEREQLWQKQIGQSKLANQLAASVLLNGNALLACAQMAKQLANKNCEVVNLSHIATARQHSNAEQLRLLAEPVLRRVSRTQLCLPEHIHQGLNLLLQRARQRESLSQGLGSAINTQANPGLRALFSGDSGTGKTLAASYIATQLAAPLYRVDLASVMNKYIGESEKNLAQLLDHAAANDVVLLFDEADSLFGSRSDGQEKGERFANMLTNFLLTRIESHPSVVILTTNGKDRIDSAFNRRIDVQLDFPMPNYEQRLQLWRAHFGPALKTTDSSKAGLGEKQLSLIASHCDFSGGQIRNAVLTAAALAQGQAIQHRSMWQALKVEYSKIGREMPRKLGFLNQSTNQSAAPAPDNG